MSVRLYGSWRLTVTEAIHNWENRFAIREASSGNGVYPPAIGSIVTVNGTSWLLDAEYRQPGGNWQDSAMIFEPAVPEQVAIYADIGAEDPLPTEDYNDIRWEGVFLNSAMFSIPYRPYAIRPDDLFQMPDGIFEASLGIYYMGVRVTNTWGIPFTQDHVLDISTAGRVALASSGIVVIDQWDNEELGSLGQRMIGTGVSIEGLRPGESRNVFFKIDVSNAPSRKHAVEFICRNVAGMADPEHPGRRATKSVYVSRTSFDSDTGEFVYHSRQGLLRMRLDEVIYDKEGYRRNRKRLREATQSSDKCREELERVRKMLKEFLDGKQVDLCKVQQILACCCMDDGRGKLVPVYEPFYAMPTRLRATFEPTFPFSGQYGPLLYDDPWWKVALLILALILWLLGALEEGAQSAYEDEDFVIGHLFRSQQHHIDAALCEIDTSRELAFQTVLDAQSDEDNQVPAEGGVGGNVTGIGPGFMTEQDVQDLLDEAALTGDTSGLRVFKSGARTGLTFAEITRFSSPWVRNDETRFDDPDRRTVEFEAVGGSGDDVSDKGDSGSVWIHVDTKRIVALNHSGNDTTAFGTIMSHVVDAFNITF